MDSIEAVCGLRGNFKLGTKLLVHFAGAVREVTELTLSNVVQVVFHGGCHSSSHPLMSIISWQRCTFLAIAEVILTCITFMPKETASPRIVRLKFGPDTRRADA